MGDRGIVVSGTSWRQLKRWANKNGAPVVKIAPERVELYLSRAARQRRALIRMLEDRNRLRAELRETGNG